MYLLCWYSVVKERADFHRPIKIVHLFFGFYVGLVGQIYLPYEGTFSNFSSNIGELPNYSDEFFPKPRMAFLSCQKIVNADFQRLGQFNQQINGG